MAEDTRRARALQAAEPLPSLLLEDDGQGADFLLASLSRVSSALEREREEAPALEAELLALPAEKRAAGLLGDPRFHNWGLCELLLARACESPDPDIARLVLLGADLLDRTLHAPPVVEDLKARAWAAAGAACLGREDLEGAEEALRAAASRLAQGTGDLLVEGTLLEFEASVRRRQGRMSEAAALLKMAAARYREIGESDLLARAVAARNALLEQRNG